MSPVQAYLLLDTVAIHREPEWNYRTLSPVCCCWCSWSAAPAWYGRVRHAVGVDVGAAHLVASSVAGAVNMAANLRRQVADDEWSVVPPCTRQWMCPRYRRHHRHRQSQCQSRRYPAIRDSSCHRATAMQLLQLQAPSMRMRKRCPLELCTMRSLPAPWYQVSESRAR